MKKYKLLIVSALALKALSAHSQDGIVEINGVEILEDSSWSCAAGVTRTVNKMHIDLISALRERKSNTRYKAASYFASGGYLIQSIDRKIQRKDSDVRYDEAKVTKSTGELISDIELQIVFENVKNHILSLNVDSVSENRLILNVEQFKDNYLALRLDYGSLGTEVKHEARVYSLGYATSDRSHYIANVDVHEVCVPDGLFDPARIEELLIEYVNRTIDSADCDLQCEAGWHDSAGNFCAKGLSPFPGANGVFPNPENPDTGLFAWEGFLYQFQPEISRICHNID